MTNETGDLPPQKEQMVTKKAKETTRKFFIDVVELNTLVQECSIPWNKHEAEYRDPTKTDRVRADFILFANCESIEGMIFETWGELWNGTCCMI